MTYEILGRSREVLGIAQSADPAELEGFYQQCKIGHSGKLKNEFFEVLTSEGGKSGQIRLRDLIHKDGDWHGAFHMHIYSIENGKTYLWLQKRRHDKDVCPNKLDTVAAGHYAIGESLEDGVREVEEEIGLKVEFSDLFSLGKRKNYDPQPANGIINCEFQDVTVHRYDAPLDSLKLQESELAGVVKVDVSEFIELMTMRRSDIKSVDALMFSEGALKHSAMNIAREDVWPAPFDNYYLKTAFIVDMLSRGVALPKNPFNLDVTTFI